MADDRSVDRPTHWWNTAPGIVTAIAAVITAAAGMIAALDQAGYIRHRTPDPVPAPMPASIALKLAACDSPSQAAEQALGMTNGAALTCHVTLINNGRAPLNLKDMSWRLLIDDVPVPPYEPIDRVVEPEMAVDAELTFPIPTYFSGGVLRVRASDSVTEAKARNPMDKSGIITRGNGH